jgi:hypothetical protein
MSPRWGSRGYVDTSTINIPPRRGWHGVYLTDIGIKTAER